ncbi:MAG: DUF4294 domain-containing protein [Bacteroidales bacterium]|nr:DUF4294 domain-containing protein [Bacteroidales bacterium]
MAGILKYMILIPAFILTCLKSTKAQENKTYYPPEPGSALVYRSDTMPVFHIPEINIYDANKYDYLHSRRYRRMIYNVKRAYPYAVIANLKLKKLDQQLTGIKSKKAQKEFIKEAEAQIMQEFEKDVKRLSVKQGIILVKLIDRETGRTSYEVLKDIRGGFTAFFWQGIARIFGNDLKLQYDPDDKDKLIEDIIMAMEYGFI